MVAKRKFLHFQQILYSKFPIATSTFRKANKHRRRRQKNWIEHAHVIWARVSGSISPSYMRTETLKTVFCLFVVCQGPVRTGFFFWKKKVSNVKLKCLHVQSRKLKLSLSFKIIILSLRIELANVFDKTTGHVQLELLLQHPVCPNSARIPQCFCFYLEC